MKRTRSVLSKPSQSSLSLRARLLLAVSLASQRSRTVAATLFPFRDTARRARAFGPPPFAQFRTFARAGFDECADLHRITLGKMV